MVKNNSWNFDATYVIGDILYASDSSTLSKLSIGSESEVLTVVTGALAYQASSSPANINNQTFSLWDDFNCAGGLDGAASQNWWRDLSTGTSGALLSLTGYNNHPGVVVLNTGTSSSGYGEIGWELSTAVGSVAFGGGTFDMTFINKIATTATSSQDFTMAWGWRNAANTSGATTDGAWFQYNRTTNSGRWTIRTMKASSGTTANTTTTPDTNWHTYKISVNADGTSVSFFIDGVEVSNSPIVTNIPVAKVSPFFNIIKTAGSTNRTVEIDYWQLDVNLTSARA